MAAKILIADDSLFSRTTLTNILKKEGYTICGEAESGEEAVEKYRRLKPDIVTMDILMSKNKIEDGITAVKDILKINPQAKIVMVSAMTQKTFITEALNAGAKDFITKPLDPAKVIDAIKRLCDEPK